MSAIILGISDDTGVRNDGITADNTLTVYGAAAPKQALALFLDGEFYETHSDGNGDWLVDLQKHELKDGEHTLIITDDALSIEKRELQIDPETIVAAEKEARAKAEADSRKSEIKSEIIPEIVPLEKMPAVAMREERGFDARMDDPRVIEIAPRQDEITDDIPFIGDMPVLVEDEETGEIGSAIYRVTIDTAIQLDVALVGEQPFVEKGMTGDARPVFGGIAAEPVSLTFFRDGVEVGTQAASGAWTYVTPDTLADGDYKFEVRAEDLAGNTASQVVVVTVDRETESDVTTTLDGVPVDLVMTGRDDIDATGNSRANHIIGNDGANVLYGLDGDDWLEGGAGNDTLIGGTGNDRLGGGDGIDTVDYSALATKVWVNLAVGLTIGDEIGNDTLLDIENIATGSGSDRLIGNDLDNRLDGGAGADSMSGGRGNDSYLIDDVGDKALERVGEGHDTVESSVSFALGANVEDLHLTGGHAIDGTGNALSNILIGNDADNVLDGKAGVDTMIGGRGDDTYVVNDARDVVVERGGEGYDTVRSAVSYRLADHVEKLLLTSGNLDGTGNALDNVLAGTAGANRLDGGAGADTMEGGKGHDTYVVDNGGDVVVELAGGGPDTVIASVSFTLSDNVENLTLVGGAALDGQGNELKNVMTGNDAANRLWGGAGNDTLDGGKGDDWLSGGADVDRLTGGEGRDTFFFTELSVASRDTITDFEVRIDTIAFERASFGFAKAGALSAGAFVIGTKALDANDRVMYDDKTGLLRFDADGTGKGAGVIIASLETGLALTHHDFLVV